jgi:hypothetical protein
MPTQRRSLAIGLAAVVTVSLVVGGVYWATRPVAPPHQSATPVASPSGEPSLSPAPPGSGVPVPASGAYLGAWVKPVGGKRADAVHSFEVLVGRKLDIVQDYHTWTEPFPNAFDQSVVDGGSYLLVSWAGQDTTSITSGSSDDMIRERARALKALKAPVLLRWRWEMDRANLADEVHSPADYVAAWKHIRAIFAAERVTNVSWVWCPLAEGFASGAAPSYYPGDDEVDWLCTDAYSVTPDQPLAPTLQPFFDWAKSHHKPVMIGEFGTQSGAPGQRAEWLAAVGATLRAHPQVKALVYFDSDVDRDNRKRDWSLRGDPPDLAAFGKLAFDPYFNTQGLPHGVT